MVFSNRCEVAICINTKFVSCLILHSQHFCFNCSYLFILGITLFSVHFHSGLEMLFRLFSTGAIALCSLLPYTNAAPKAPLEPRSALSKRQFQLLNCNQQQSNTLHGALEDMRQMASLAATEAGTNNPGY